MSNYRDTYRYYVKEGNRILHVGVTSDFQRREYELKQELGEKVHLKRVGARTSRDIAFEWMAEQTAKREKATGKKSIPRSYTSENRETLQS